MREVPINEYLSGKSNWPRRLLGLDSYNVTRSRDLVVAEYESDRYAPLVALESTDIEAYKIAEFALLKMPYDGEHLFSMGEAIFGARLSLVQRFYNAWISDIVSRWREGSLLELGCGYGFNLASLGSEVYGGDFSTNAVAIARRLGHDVFPFDYLDADSYGIVRPNTTVLTVHSIEQLPSARTVLDNLAANREKIRRVIHLEPTFVPERTSFLGAIRNRYNELIDHNHDLLALLRSRDDVRILEFTADVFGIHPLNSANAIVWEFA